MVIFNKKDLVIPRGLGNVAVSVTSGYTDSISREEVQEMIDEAITGSTAGVASINGETGAVKIKTINSQSLMGEDNIEISGTTPYVLPTATPTRLGGVKIGSGISVAADGTISTAASGIHSETISTIWTGTLAQYNAMEEHRSDTLYFIQQP